MHCSEYRLIFLKANPRTLLVHICKVVIYKYVFCWLLFYENLIVIIFNLLYPVFIVGFDCKGCVLERECEDSSN